MDGSSFIKSHIATVAYTEGFRDGIDGMRAVCFALRNRFDACWWNSSWPELLNHYRDIYPRAYSRDERIEIPDPRIYSFQQILQEVDGIFDGTRKDDVTVPKETVLSKPASPVLWWARLNEIDSEEFLEQISRRPDIHPRVAVVGSMTFFA